MKKINDVVTAAFELDREIKEKTKTLETLKAEIRKYAEENGVREIGNPLVAVALVSDKKETTIDPKKLFKELPLKVFFKMVKVCIGDIKDAYGEVFVKKIATVKENPYAVVRFTKA